MKKYVHVFIGAILLTSLFLSGCSDHNGSSSPTVAVSTEGVGHIEGQFVAESGTQFAKLATAAVQGAYTASVTVYPISGAAVELIRNRTVVSTTTTDEYGRFRFTNLSPGTYDIRFRYVDGLYAQHSTYVNAEQTMTVYGRAIPGECLWTQEPGPHWEDMPHGSRWGRGFCGASPGSGYWHDGQEWRGPGSGPHHGPHH